MSFVAKGIGSLGNALFGGLGLLIKPFTGKKKKLIQPRPVTRDDEIARVEADDELRRRRGAGADMITGTRGAEAAAGSIGRLVIGS